MLALIDLVDGSRVHTLLKEIKSDMLSYHCASELDLFREGLFLVEVVLYISRRKVSLGELDIGLSLRLIEKQHVAFSLERGEAADPADILVERVQGDVDVEVLANPLIHIHQ